MDGKQYTRDDVKLGHIVILNGAPRAGKSSIAAEMQKTFDGLWINLGVDHYKTMIPERYQPGIGLRPGGECPHLEPLIVTMYHAMYASIAAHSRLGINVVTDVGHHELYSTSLPILSQCAQLLKLYPTLLVGVKCPIEEIMRRRTNTDYPSYTEDGAIPEPIRLWQQSVHVPGIYDLEVDTSINTSCEIAKMIQARLNEAHFTAIHRLAERFQKILQ